MIWEDTDKGRMKHAALDARLGKTELNLCFYRLPIVVALKLVGLR